MHHPRRLPTALAAMTFVTSVGLAVPQARADEPAPVPTSPVKSPSAEPSISSPGLVAGGAALGLFGLGATGLGVYLTAKGSTLDCIQCVDSNDDAPLVVGGLTVVVLGLGMAAAGGTMVVLGLRDTPSGVHVAELRAGLGSATLAGRF